MSYEALDITGAVQTLALQQKITRIDGEPVELYVVGVEAEARVKRKPKRLIDPVDVEIQSLLSVDANNVPTYDDAFTVKSQIHWEEEKTFDSERGIWVPKSTGFLAMRHAPNPYLRKLLVVKFHDQLGGFALVDQVTVTFSIVTYPNKTWRGDLGEPVTVTRDIAIAKADLTAGTSTEDGIVLKTGCAMLSLRRDLISLAEINDRQNYFTISLNGTSLGDFVIDPQKEGVCIEKTHHFNVYLTRRLGS